MGISRYNASGYLDMTAHLAIQNMEREEKVLHIEYPTGYMNIRMEAFSPAPSSGRTSCFVWFAVIRHRRTKPVCWLPFSIWRRSTPIRSDFTASRCRPPQKKLTADAISFSRTMPNGVWLASKEISDNLKRLSAARRVDL